MRGRPTDAKLFMDGKGGKSFDRSWEATSGFVNVSLSTVERQDRRRLAPPPSGAQPSSP